MKNKQLNISSKNVNKNILLLAIETTLSHHEGQQRMRKTHD